MEPEFKLPEGISKIKNNSLWDNSGYFPKMFVKTESTSVLIHSPIKALDLENNSCNSSSSMSFTCSPLLTTKLNPDKLS